MDYYISHIKDSVNNNYLAINIYSDVVSPFLSKLKNVLSNEYDTYVKNQQNRDNNHHHITVINVMEYNKLSKDMGMSEFVNSLDSVLKYTIDDLKMMGLGSASKNENTAYFVVCKSEKLDAVRKRYNLPPYHFHITLGFKWKDVFGLPKNEILIEESNFIKLLKVEFYKKENFNFLRKVENYKTDPDLDIIPLSISDNYIKRVNFG